MGFRSSKFGRAEKCALILVEFLVWHEFVVQFVSSFCFLSSRRAFHLAPTEASATTACPGCRRRRRRPEPTSTTTRRSAGSASVLRSLTSEPGSWRRKALPENFSWRRRTFPELRPTLRPPTRPSWLHPDQRWRRSLPVTRASAATASGRRSLLGWTRSTRRTRRGPSSSRSSSRACRRKKGSLLVGHFES